MGRANASYAETAVQHSTSGDKTVNGFLAEGPNHQCACHVGCESLLVFGLAVSTGRSVNIRQKEMHPSALSILPRSVELLKLLLIYPLFIILIVSEIHHHQSEV